MFDRWKDVEMVAALDLQGSSRITGGLFRGRAQGNVFNIGDSRDVLGTDSPILGKLKVFNAGEDPSSKQPQMTVKVKVSGTLAPVLGELGKRFSPVKSKILNYLLWFTKNNVSQRRIKGFSSMRRAIGVSKVALTLH